MTTVHSSYDVAVLGLGAMGSMTAWRAASRGARVLGVEQFGIAHANGSSHGGSRIFRRTLFEGVAYVPIVDRAASLWRELATASGRTLFRRSGGLCIGPRDGKLIADALRSAEVGGFEHHVLEPDELVARFPQHGTVPTDAAVFEPDAGVLNPEECIRAATDLAAAAGAELRTGTAVRAVHQRDDGVHLDLGGETVHARRVVVATGAWFTELTGTLDIPLRVQRSPLVWFTGADDAAREAHTYRHFPVFVRKSGELDGWGIPDVDGRGPKVGAGPSAPKPWLAHPADNGYPIDARDTGPVEFYVRNALPGLDPVAAAATPCMNSRSADRDFVLGIHPDAPSLVLAGAFSGHGFKHAAGVGDIAAELALDGACDVELERFAPDRFAGKGDVW